MNINRAFKIILNSKRQDPQAEEFYENFYTAVGFLQGTIEALLLHCPKDIQDKHEGVDDLFMGSDC